MGPYSNDPGNAGPASMPGTPMWAGNAGVPQRPGVTPVMIAQGPKWPALRIIAILLKVIAWIELVLGIILALATGVTGGSIAANIRVSSIGGASLLAALFVLIGAVLGFIWTYASAEIIMLFITIEKNTRPR